MLISSPSVLACSETIDTDHVEHDVCCSDYARDIFSYLKEAEVWYHAFSELTSQKSHCSGTMAA